MNQKINFRILYLIIILAFIFLLFLFIWKAKQNSDVANEKFDKQNERALAAQEAERKLIEVENKLNSGEFPANVLVKENEILLNYYGEGGKENFTHSILQKNGTSIVKFERIKEEHCSQGNKCRCNQIVYLFSELNIPDIRNTKFIFEVKNLKLQDHCAIDSYSCTSDIDCGKIYVGCCGNDRFIAVNVNSRRRVSRCEPTQCPGDGMSTDWTQHAPTKCISGKCELVKLEQGQSWPEIIKNNDLLSAKNRIDNYSSKEILSGEIASYLPDVEHSDLIDLLLSQGVNPNYTLPGRSSILWSAIAKNNIIAVEALNKYGAKLNNSYEVLLVNILSKKINLIEELVKKDKQLAEFIKGTQKNSIYPKPMHFAAKNGDYKIIELLIRMGANPNEDIGNSYHPNTPLVSAAIANNIETFKALVELGATVKGRQGIYLYHSGVKISIEMKKEIEKHLSCKWIRSAYTCE